MHHHVAERNDRYILTIRDMLERTAMNIVHRTLMQHETHPPTPGKSLVEPFDLRFERLFSGWKYRHQNREAIRHATQMRIVAIGP